MTGHKGYFTDSDVPLITLCNKDFGAWDISTDSIILGVTDT